MMNMKECDLPIMLPGFEKKLFTQFRLFVSFHQEVQVLIDLLYSLG